MAAIDARLFFWLNAALSGERVLWVMAALTTVGAGWTLLAFLPLLAFARTRRFGGALVGTLVATSLVVFALKGIVGRARPCASLAGVHARVFAAPTDFSFPSGHAAGAFACAGFVAMVVLEKRPLAVAQWLAAAGLVLLALGIGLSRIALGVHFPGDVAAGAAVGAMLGIAGARLHLRAAVPAPPSAARSAPPSAARSAPPPPPRSRSPSPSPSPSDERAQP